MKFYFCASARGLDALGQHYKNIVEISKELGNTSVDDLAIEVNPKEFYQNDHDAQAAHYNQTIKNIKLSDIVLLEVSTHSLSMGFIMNRALEYGKPVIALYQSGHFPHFAAGIDNEKLQLLEYTEDTLHKTLAQAFEYAKDSSDTRFNFFISPRHINYLDWIAKSKKIPRSVYLRDLIQQDMGKNDEFQKAA